jgi:methylated-DNA-[protein]-cysteine S-methyltransferase
MTHYTHIETPVGNLLATSDGQALTGLYMPEHRRGPEIGAEWIADDTAAPFALLRSQLAEFFSGDRSEFDLPLAASGTDFQKRVWEELRRIPYGDRVSYGEIARRIGSPSAVRAVGMANARNPVSIVVPCHRVVGSNDSLTGYAGGVDRKRFLLDWEHAHRVSMG